MKSYFARLAARAVAGTARVVPVSKPPTVDDPFETSIETPTSRDLTAPKHEPAPTRDSGLQDPGNARLEVEPRIDRSRPQLQTHPELRPMPRPETQTTSPLVADHSSKEKDTQRSEIKLSPQPDVTPARDDRKVDDTIQRLNVESPDETDADRERFQEEQTALLRKADSFMASLLARRPGEPKQKQEDATLDPKPDVDEKPQPQPYYSLTPNNQQAVIVEREVEKPSLVIGKLTVEVVPPAAPVATPSTRVVVVREPRRSRSTAPTNRRFGLGQF